MKKKFKMKKKIKIFSKAQKNTQNIYKNTQKIIKLFTKMQ